MKAKKIKPLDLCAICREIRILGADDEVTEVMFDEIEEKINEIIKLLNNKE